MDKYSTLLQTLINFNHKKFYNIEHRGRIHNTSFSLKIINQPNKLECYIKLGWKGLPATNALAYWACSKVIMKMKCCEYSPRSFGQKPFDQPTFGQHKCGSINIWPTDIWTMNIWPIDIWLMDIWLIDIWSTDIYPTDL
jgi:hypothetical protein